MQKFWQFLLLPLVVAASVSAQAAPVMVPALSSQAQSYAFFYTDPSVLIKRGIDPKAFKDSVNSQLPVGVSACWVPGDINATDIRCADPVTGQVMMQLGYTELYSYTLEVLLPKDPIVVDRNAVFKQVEIANAISAGGNLLPDTIGRVSHVHFNARMAQFGMLVDPNSATSIQFVVNGQSLPPQPLTAGTLQYVAVEDAHGFSDVTIIAGGFLGQTFVADRLGFLPLSKF